MLLFNMNRDGTRDAFRTARETPNRYIQVSEDIPLENLEAVYALDINKWAFPYDPVTQDPTKCQAEGVTNAHLLCQYFSRCYVQRPTTPFNDLPRHLQDAVVTCGQWYEQNLRYSGDGATPGSLAAETPAKQTKTKRDKVELIADVVQELGTAVKTEKIKVEAKLMATSSKKDPPPLPETCEGHGREEEGQASSSVCKNIRDTGCAEVKTSTKALGKQIGNHRNNGED